MVSFNGLVVATSRACSSLIRSASKNEHDAPNLDELDVSFFISTELHEIADRLEVT